MISISILLLAISLLVCTSANASAIRVALLADVSVSGDVILLSHLLAEPFPSALRDVAAKVSLGNSPQFGTIRRIPHSKLAFTIADAGLEKFDFQIPETITVRRSGRLVTNQEIAAAIQHYLLVQNPLSTLQNSTDELTINGSLLVPDGPLDLYVRSSRYDLTLRCGRFSLASHAFPRMNSFEVNITTQVLTTRGLPQVFPVKHPLAPILVRPGVPAQLLVRAADTRMILSVLPTKQGRQGDVIRVRLAKTGAFLNAKVVGENSLEASY